jgi:hypothetical protein
LQPGELDLNEHLYKHRDREVTLIIVATGEAKEEPIVCGICGFALNKVSDCPQCRLMNKEVARRIEARQEERSSSVREDQPVAAPLRPVFYQRILLLSGLRHSGG